MLWLAIRIKWKEVFKFLAGVTFASALVNGYLYWTRVAVPFLGYTISPELLGLRGAVHLVLFLTFFYFGYIKE